MTIGFFDSGIGGLTVLSEALRRLPANDYLYMADT
ncbi:glutamate racemase, partial [Paenibacillus sp. MCAF20]